MVNEVRKWNHPHLRHAAEATSHGPIVEIGEQILEFLACFYLIFTSDTWPELLVALGAECLEYQIELALLELALHLDLLNQLNMLQFFQLVLVPLSRALRFICDCEVRMPEALLAKQLLLDEESDDCEI